MALCLPSRIEQGRFVWNTDVLVQGREDLLLPEGIDMGRQLRRQHGRDTFCLVLQDVYACPSRLQGIIQGGALSNTNQRLTKIAALQHGSECLWRLLKSGP